MRCLFGLGLLLFVPLACGGSSEQESGGGGTATGGTTNRGGSGPGGGGLGTGGSSGSGCPGSVPTDGSNCNLTTGGSSFGNAADCSWGDDIRPRCRTHGVCMQGEWTITAPGTECETDPLPATCPTAPATPGSECAGAGLECWYDDGTLCTCSPCEGGLEYPICREINPPE